MMNFLYLAYVASAVAGLTIEVPPRPTEDANSIGTKESTAPNQAALDEPASSFDVDLPELTTDELIDIYERLAAAIAEVVARGYRVDQIHVERLAANALNTQTRWFTGGRWHFIQGVGGLGADLDLWLKEDDASSTLLEADTLPDAIPQLERYVDLGRRLKIQAKVHSPGTSTPRYVAWVIGTRG